MTVKDWKTYGTQTGGTTISKDRVAFVEAEGQTQAKITFLTGHSVVVDVADIKALAVELGLHANFGGSDADPRSGQWFNLRAVDAVVGHGEHLTIHLQNGLTIQADGRRDQFVWGLKLGEAQRLGTPFTEPAPPGTVIT